MKTTHRINRNYSKAIALLCMLFGMVLSYGQDPVMKFEGKVSNATGQKLSGVLVKIYRDGKEVHSVTTASNGKYQQYEAYYGYTYKIVFSKDDLVTKSIEVNAKDNFFEEDVEKEIAIPIDVTMINREPDINYGPVESKPVARFHIDKNTGLMDIDYPFVNERKKEIDDFFEKLAKAEKDNEKKFKDLVKEGDNGVKGQKFEEAIAKYKAALDIKQDDDVKAKLDNAQTLFEQQKGSQADNEKFNKLIKEGDDLVASNKFDEAIDKYKKAQEVKPKEKLPQDKINEANQKRQSLAANKVDQEYATLITEAKKQKAAKEYQKAIETFTKAKQVKPTEREPDQEIKDINDIINREGKSKAEYDRLIAAGDNLFKNKTYKEAQGKYEDALKLVPGEKHPTDRIAEIKKLLKEEQSADATELAKKAKYQDFIDKADIQLKNKDFTSAKENYTKASELYPDETYPKGKLKEIENVIRDNETKYQQLIKEGDKLMADKNYREAILKFEDATLIKKNESYPQSQIVKAKELLGESKQNEADAKRKKEKYDLLIDEGNKFFRVKDYTKAIKSFEEASSLFPTEAYPKEQIKNINDLLNQNGKEYNDLISAADKQLESGEFAKSIETYQKALKVKDDQYPKDQITKARKLIADKEKQSLNAEEKEKKYQELKAQADRELTNQNFNLARDKYQEALNIKPEAEEPKKQIAFIDDMIKKRKERYEKYISQADDLFKDEKFEVSIEKYEEALWILPVEQYPKDQIELARKRLENKKNGDLEEGEKNKKYQDLIQRANFSFSNQNYKEAKEHYNSALNLKPDEQYPKDQLKLIEEKLKLLAEKNAKELEEQEREKKYKDIINQADSKFDNQKFEESKELYLKALELKKEPYPQAQISRINEKLTEINQKEEVKKQYQKIIAAADEKFKGKEYDEAKGLYNRALVFNPSAEYPALKITEIDKILAELSTKEKLEQEEEARKNLLYQKLISSGDKDYERKFFKEARNNYQEASFLKPEEIYPKNKMLELDKLIAELDKEEEKYKGFSSDYFKMDAEAYGEEVNISESDADLIISKSIDDREYENYLKMRRYVDSMKTVDIKDVERNTDNTYLSFEDYDRIKQKITKENEKADINREQNVTSYQLFLDYYAKEKEKEATNAYEYNGEIANQIDDLKEEIIEKESTGQSNIEENAKNYEKLNDRFVNEDKAIKNENTDKTSEIFNETENFKEKLIAEHNDGQEAIEANAKNYERLNDRFVQEDKAIKDENIDKTSEIYNQTERLKEKLITQQNDGQEAIEVNAKNYERLNDRFYEENKEKNIAMLDFQSELAGDIDNLKERLIQDYADGQYSIELNAKNYERLNDRFAEEDKSIKDENINKTGEIYNQTENLKEKLIAEHNDGQATIEANAKNYERLNDRFVNQDKAIKDDNTNKTSEIYNQTTRLKDHLIDDQKDGQEKIEGNAKMYENYNDKLTHSKEKQAENQARVGQEVANDIEKLKEKRIVENQAGNIAIEANAANYESLNERLTNQKEYLAEKNTDDTYKNAGEYESIKENMDKHESENVKNQLALMFPEGVTQKVYQRKNEEGEVVEVTVKRVVVRGNKGNEYRKTTSRTGSYYFKNGLPITSNTWDLETAGKIVNSDE